MSLSFDLIATLFVLFFLGSMAFIVGWCVQTGTDFFSFFEKYTSRFSSFREYRYNRRVFATSDRKPFYRYLLKHIPNSGIIVDIGSGDGSFIRFFESFESIKDNIYAVEGNAESADRLRSWHKNVIESFMPCRLPFEDGTVSVVHCSHVLEHMTPDQVYDTMKEVDRVLSPDGVFIIACPLLEKEGLFYDDLSHVKPYTPVVFRKYLCSNSVKATRSTVSSSYKEIDFVYRWFSYPIKWDIQVPFLFDLFLCFVSKVLSLFGVKKYQKSGYMIVFKKNKNQQE